MINLPKDLQKKNFLDAMRKMTPFPGWAVLERNNLLALKSGAQIPLVNFVWGDATLENIEIIRSFYPWQNSKIKPSIKFIKHLQGKVGREMILETK